MYSIKAVSRLTGLTSDTLRAWERRYQAVEPRREDNGRRYYTEDDIARLQLLRRAVESGHPIRNLAGRSDRELRDLVRVEAAPPTGVGSTAAVHLALRDTLKDALDSWDASRFEQTLALAAATVPTDDLAEALLAPIAREVGERWASGDISIAQERIASAAIRKVVLTAVNAIKPTAGHRSIVLATLPGERHELGILLAGLVASTRRFGCHFVGADAPAAETARMTERTGACAVGIGVVLPPDLDTVLADLAELCRLVGEGTPVFVGGAGAGRLCGLPLPANCHLVGDLKEFADRLELTAEA